MREGLAFGLPRGAPRSGGRKSLVKRPYHWPHSPIVVPFWGAYLESYRVIPKRNYYWVMLLKPKALQGHSDCPQQALGGKRRNKSTHNVGVFGPIILNIKEEPPPMRCNLGVYPLARRTGTQTHRSLLFLQAHGCSQYSARTLSNRHRYMQVIRETVRAPGCVTSVFQPGTNLKTRRTA